MRLGIHGDGTAEGEPEPLIHWLESWRTAGGNRETLRLMVNTLLAQRLEEADHS